MAFTGFNNIRPPKAEMRKYVPVKREVAEVIGKSIGVTIHLTGWDWGEQDWDDPNFIPAPGTPSDNGRTHLDIMFDPIEVIEGSTLFDVLIALWNRGDISGDSQLDPPLFEEADNMDPNTSGNHPTVQYLSAMRIPPDEGDPVFYYDEQEGYIPDPPTSGDNLYKGVSWVYFIGISSDRPNTINGLPPETIDLMYVDETNKEFTFSYDAFELKFIMP